ncbi:hypothetical protein G5714_016403 [Onychostoma macrolepis]|uniref:Jacalin-type lectin domain-containing protein n=1 Tax=Onychostoma macrolepis TaxID=369639 RepID=A0A7J6C8C5_9TELE|nr:hypothetical protein G5714_016403 [Onychostoma macrolepis]
MLHLILVLSGVCTVGMTMPLPDYYSYSMAIGDGSGTEYSTAYDGRITGIRVWEHSNAYIRGIQLRYDGNWTSPVCSSSGNPMELSLRDNESIIQASGKYYSGYIYEIMFVTSQGRSLKVGQPTGNSFNLYPTNGGMGMTMPLPDYYSYSMAIGDGSGTEYSTAYDGRITGIRVWEHSNAYIRGIQLRYDGNWTSPVCSSSGNPMELSLRDNESIIQASGKYYSGYIYEIMFVTSQGRSLKVGQPTGNSFNLYPTNGGIPREYKERTAKTLNSWKC